MGQAAIQPLREQIGDFHVVGYIVDGSSIQALLVAEREPYPRIVGRVEFSRPGVLNQDALEALAFLSRSSPPIRLPKQVRGVRWAERRLIATVKHSGRTEEGALRSGVLQGLAVA